MKKYRPYTPSLRFVKLFRLDPKTDYSAHIRAKSLLRRDTTLSALSALSIGHFSTESKSGPKFLVSRYGEYINSASISSLGLAMRVPLHECRVGKYYSSISPSTSAEPKICRSPGTRMLIRRFGNDSNKNVLCVLPSKKEVWMSSKGSAIFGRAPGRQFKMESMGKAGRSAHRGYRPHVRGVAMNPVDHPHGGGEGKKSKLPVPLSKSGRNIKWRKTRRK